MTRGLRVRPGVAAWLSAALALAWALLWTGVAWGEWHTSFSDRDLMAHGHLATGVVAAAADSGEIKLGYCRQVLDVTSAAGGSLTVLAARGCTDPWQVGDRITVVQDQEHPDRAVVASEAQIPLSTHALPILVVALAAIIGGYPLGRTMIAFERRRGGRGGRGTGGPALSPRRVPPPEAPPSC